MTRPKVVAFDIIGTMFSLEPVRPKLTGLGLPPLSLEFLYTAALRDAFALATTTTFAPFSSMFEGALDELLATQGVTATEDQKADVLATMGRLPPHDDADAALRTLADANLRVFALSNGAASRTQALLDRAGLARYVEQILSVEAVKLAKPRPEVYLYAVAAAGVRPDEMALVASHAWDIHGAKTAGLIGAYVSRGIPYPSALMRPDVTGASMLDVARRLASAPG